MGLVDGSVVIGTETGTKGVDLRPEVLRRVWEAARSRGSKGNLETYVDGRIQYETVPEITRIGADEKVQGSLVLGVSDWGEPVRWLHSQTARSARRAR